MKVLGDLRLLNVTAGIGGRSYMSFTKVPAKLEAFYAEMNEARHRINPQDLKSLYDLSFDAHYGLVTIHPWADGNGLMARLLMNQIQFEFDAIPSKVLKEDKEEYVKSLSQSQETGDSRFFKDFMHASLCRNLQKEIDEFLRSTEMGGENLEMGGENAKRGEKTRDVILRIIRENPQITMAALAEKAGISAKAIEKQIARLKKDSLLVRVGPDKGGHWEVL